MATVTEAVKETLVGTTKEPELSSQTKATFDRHARQDEGAEELYMTETEFVNAIAPETEDYVSVPTFARNSLIKINLLKRLLCMRANDSALNSTKSRESNMRSSSKSLTGERPDK